MSLPQPIPVIHPIPVDKLIPLMQRCQAQRIFKRFGGLIELHHLLKLSSFRVSKYHMLLWCAPFSYPRGNGGMVPARAIAVILKICKFHGLYIRAEDWNPKHDPPPKHFYDRTITYRIRQRQKVLDAKLQLYFNEMKKEMAK